MSRSRIIVGSCWSHSGIIFGSCWSRSRIIVGSFRSCSRIIVGLCWSRYRITVGSCWSHQLKIFLKVKLFLGWTISVYLVECISSHRMPYLYPNFEIRKDWTEGEVRGLAQRLRAEDNFSPDSDLANYYYTVSIYWVRDSARFYPTPVLNV